MKLFLTPAFRYFCACTHVSFVTLVRTKIVQLDYHLSISKEQQQRNIISMCYLKTRLRVLVNAPTDQKRCGGGFNGTLVTATAWRLKHKSRTDTRSWHCHIRILVCLTALPQDAVKYVMVFWWQRGVGDLGILHIKPGRCVECVLNDPFLYS